LNQGLSREARSFFVGNRDNSREGSAWRENAFLLHGELAALSFTADQPNRTILFLVKRHAGAARSIYKMETET
jgi:hypothetical protein